MNAHNVRVTQKAHVGDTAYARCFDFDRCLWLAEVHLRAGSEVCYLRGEYPQLPPQVCLETDAYEKGMRSPRSFAIAQGYDRSVHVGAMALFGHFAGSTIETRRYCLRRRMDALMRWPGALFKRRQNGKGSSIPPPERERWSAIVASISPQCITRR
jgi:hypothetical protein